jgi:hypothetical protein
MLAHHARLPDVVRPGMMSRVSSVPGVPDVTGVTGVPSVPHVMAPRVHRGLVPTEAVTTEAVTTEAMSAKASAVAAAEAAAVSTTAAVSVSPGLASTHRQTEQSRHQTHPEAIHVRILHTHPEPWPGSSALHLTVQEVQPRWAETGVSLFLSGDLFDRLHKNKRRPRVAADRDARNFPDSGARG